MIEEARGERSDAEAGPKGSGHGSEADEVTPKRGVLSKYLRAKVRHFLLTVTADRMTRGGLSRRHRAQNVETRELELRIPRWPTQFDGLRIAHISDFHVGHLMTSERAIDVVNTVRDLKPDLVACTGDVVDLGLECGVDGVLAALGAVGAPLGSLLVLGNHDHLDNGRKLVRMAKAAGVQTLVDESVTLTCGLRVGGIDWGKSIRECSTRVGRVWRGAGGVDLLLAHNPKAFVGAARLGVPLTLSGHTHGGQVSLRKRSNDISFRRRLRAGLYRRDDSILFVTVGLGAWFPLRVNCPPEVVVLTARSE
ncbi:MAG: metallophosphoesterase [Phycisphaerae bacterium]|jgi:predicted MPP superfamily phosphohydrolase|nr:metallophosphoesterase [Phycisphaerae bacterium]